MDRDIRIRSLSGRYESIRALFGNLDPTRSPAAEFLIFPHVVLPYGGGPLATGIEGEENGRSRRR
jgi:hypothetical protein